LQGLPSIAALGNLFLSKNFVSHQRIGHEWQSALFNIRHLVVEDHPIFQQCPYVNFLVGSNEFSIGSNFWWRGKSHQAVFRDIWQFVFGNVEAGLDITNHCGLSAHILKRVNNGQNSGSHSLAYARDFVWKVYSFRYPRTLRSTQDVCLFEGSFGGPFGGYDASASDKDAPYANANKQKAEYVGYPIKDVAVRIALNRDVCGGEFADRYGAFFVFGGFAVGIILEAVAITILFNKRNRWFGWSLSAASGFFWLVSAITPMVGRLPWDWWRHYNCEENSEQRQIFQHNAENVPQKPLDFSELLHYSNYMANVLNMDKQIAVIGALAEGSSIRSIERITGVHRDTIMRLGVKVGQGCTALMDEKMQNLPCRRLEMDEIWGFVGKKERHIREGETGVGSVWTFCAIDADTKLVPAFKVGDRSVATANAFIQDVADRMAYRVQISTDGLRAYVDAIENAFGGDVDYAQIIKVYGHEETNNNRRYSAPEFVSAEKKVIVGNPDERLISTSYVERLNATTRLHMRRLTRLTLAFSKKRENFEAAVGLHFAYYNFVKRHNTLRCTPAMAAGVTSGFWSVDDLVEAVA
jgi:IS1 family transposase